MEPILIYYFAHGNVSLYLTSLCMKLHTSAERQVHTLHGDFIIFARTCTRHPARLITHCVLWV
jgi:hypothetical protein